MNPQIVTYRLDTHGIAYIAMRDTEKKNTLSALLVDQLIATLTRAEQEGARVVVLSGLPDVFCAGAEREILRALSEGEVHVKDLLLSEKLVSLSIPIISAIEGHAIGGGLVIAACSDIVVLAEESRYGAVFMTMGFTPGMGATTLLELLFGAPLAHEMMYTGRRFRGRELAQRGVHINRVVPKKEVAAVAKDIALQIAEKNPKSVALLKYTLSVRKRKLLIDARLQEDLMHRVSFGYPETKEIIDEFYHQ